MHDCAFGLLSIKSIKNNRLKPLNLKINTMDKANNSKRFKTIQNVFTFCS